MEPAWEREGITLGRELDECFAAVVIGDNPSAAAALALGIAAIQARRRRVAVCDLVGDVPPLQRLVKEEDPHGIVDSFQYGVSLNKIAYQVDDGGNLFVMPSGTEPVVDESILRSDRWRRLSGGFREVGALLLLVAKADAPGLEDLLRTTDGLIVAGDNPRPELGPVIAAAALPAAEPPAVPPVVPPPAAPPARVPGVERRAVRRRSVPGWVVPAVVTLGVLVAVGGWWVNRNRTAAVAPPVSSDSVAALPDTLGAVAFSPALGDSLEASGYALEIVKLNTQSGAILKLHDLFGRLPAVTYSPVTVGTESSRWFTVIAGAYRTRAEVDSARTSLRDRGVIDQDVGTLVQLPFALVLQPEVSRETATAVVKAYLLRGLPAYALLQDDGTARVYAGAFETPEQAAILAASVSAAGIEPMVAYRMGRTF